MEKQMLLKEAATRKKLLALKQQLQADSRMHLNNKLVAKSSSKNSTADDREMVAPKTAQSEKFHTAEHEVTSRLSISMNGNWPARMSVNSQPSETPPASSITTATTMSNTRKVNHSVNQDNSSLQEEKKQKYKQSSFGPLLLDTTSLSGKASVTDHKPGVADKAKEVTSPRVSKEEVITVNQTKTSTNESNLSTAKSTHNSSTTARQRLAVPDTVKETEYMSAVTKQKARVSKIRKAIQAAVVIQRAWRQYKQNHVILK